MRSFIFAILLAAFGALPAHAAGDWHFTTGEELAHGVSMCLDLTGAQAIVNAHRDSGAAAGEKAWAENARCRNMPISGGPLVGKVVYSVSVKRDGEDAMLRVVEVLHPDGKTVLAYFITMRKVLPAGRGA